MLLVLGSDDADSARLRELLQGDLTDDALLTEALTLLRAHPAMAAAQARLSAYVEQARAVAADLPAGPVRDALLALTGFVLARTG